MNEAQYSQQGQQADPNCAINDNNLVQSIMDEIKNQEATQPVVVPQQIPQVVPQQATQQVPIQFQQPRVITTQNTPRQSMVQKVMKQGKDIGIVTLISMVMTQPGVYNTILKMIPKALDVNGQVTMIGTIIRSLLMGVLFYVAKLFL